MGRLVTGDTANGTLYGPYKQTYEYDVWGNLKARTWRTFFTAPIPPYHNFPQTNSRYETYFNNRNTASGWSYDEDGRLLTSTDNGANFSFSYDAAGRIVAAAQPGKTVSESYDGGGQRAKWVENGDATYYIRSTVMGGQVLTELNSSGGKKRGYVYAGGNVVAKQESGQVLWDQRDVSGVSMRMTNSVGTVTTRIETDPLGTIVDDTQTYNYNGGGNGYAFNPIGSYGTPTMPSMGCTMDGVPTACGMVMNALRGGAAEQCPNNDCGPRVTNVPGVGNILTNPFRAYADGWSGFTFAGTTYVGNGVIFNSSWTGAGSEFEPFPSIEFGGDWSSFASYFTPPDSQTKKKKRQRGRRPSPSPLPTPRPPEPVMLPAPLSNKNAPDASVSGRLEPCEEEETRVMRAIAESFVNSKGERGTFNRQVAPNKWSWNIDLPSGLSTTDRDRVMKSLGFESMLNINVIEHWPSGIMSHWQGNVNGNWYHIIFGGGWLQDLYVNEKHYEIHKPSSKAHANDYKNGIRVSGRARCP